MKRMLAVILLICMPAALLAACKTAPDDSGTVTDSAEAPGDTTAGETDGTDTEETTSDDYFDNNRIELVEPDRPPTRGPRPARGSTCGTSASFGRSLMSFNSYGISG